MRQLLKLALELGFLAGLALIVEGVHRIYAPLAYVAGGLLLCAVCLLLYYGIPRRRRA